MEEADFSCCVEVLRGPFEDVIVYNCPVLFLETVGKDLTNHYIKFAPLNWCFLYCNPSCILTKPDLSISAYTCLLFYALWVGMVRTKHFSPP